MGILNIHLTGILLSYENEDSTGNPFGGVLKSIGGKIVNPAWRLVAIIEQWQASLSSVAEYQRDLESEEELKLSIEAVSCLREIKLLFDTAKENPKSMNLSLYEKYFNVWVKTVFHYPRNWGTEGVSIAEAELDMLKSFGDLINIHLGNLPYSPTVLHSNKDQILEKLNELQHLLVEDDQLDSNLKNHIQWLMTKITEALKDEEESGLFDLSEALWHLRIFVEAAATRTKDPSKSEEFKKWVAAFFAHPFVNTVAGSALGTTSALIGIGQ